MRILSSIVQVTMTAGAVLAPWLLVATQAEAAQRPASSKYERRLVCDPRVPSRRALARLAVPVAQAPTVLRELAPRLRRAGGIITSDDDDAIQNDAPAARFDAESRLAPLQPLGLLVHSHVLLPRHRSFSPRSPRGPPAR